MEKTKSDKKIRFNLLDILLIALFIVSLILLFRIFFSDGAFAVKEDDSVDLIFTVESKKIREEYRGLISVGDTFVDTVGHYTLGEVINVQYAEATYTGLDQSTGKMVTTPYPNHLKVTITVRAKATKNDMSYSIGGYRMSIGTEVFYRVPRFTFSGYCTGIRMADEGNS